METKQQPLKQNSKPISLPSFSKRAENTIYFNKLQKERLHLEKRVKSNSNTEAIFEDIMNMMRLNREYLQKETKGNKKRIQMLSKMKYKPKEALDDENETFQKLGGMCIGVKEYRIRVKQIPKRVSLIQQQTLESKKRFAMFSSFSKQPDNVQKSLADFLIQKQKLRYKQKIGGSKQAFPSLHNSMMPGQYVPMKLMQTLSMRKHKRMVTQEI